MKKFRASESTAAAAKLTAAALLVLSVICLVLFPASEGGAPVPELAVPEILPVSEPEPKVVPEPEIEPESEPEPEPEPEYIDMRGEIMDLESMEALANENPWAIYTFSFNFAGTDTDSTVTELDIRGTTVESTEYVSRYLRFMPDLQYLDMCDCGLSDDEMASLRDEFPQVKFVWRVHMLKWSLRTDAVAFSTQNASDSVVKLSTEDIQPLKYCTDLVALDLGHQLIDDISVIGTLKNLKALVLVDNLFSDLEPLTGLDKLCFLEIYANDNIVDVEPLTRLPSLKELNISKCHSIEDFSSFLSFDGIEMLFFNDTHISDEMYKSLIDAFPEATVYGDSYYSNGGYWRGSERYNAMRRMYDSNVIEDIFSDEADDADTEASDTIDDTD